MQDEQHGGGPFLVEAPKSSFPVPGAGRQHLLPKLAGERGGGEPSAPWHGTGDLLLLEPSPSFLRA